MTSVRFFCHLTKYFPYKLNNQEHHNPPKKQEWRIKESGDWQEAKRKKGKGIAIGSSNEQKGGTQVSPSFVFEVLCVC